MFRVSDCFVFCHIICIKMTEDCFNLCLPTLNTYNIIESVIKVRIRISFIIVFYTFMVGSSADEVPLPHPIIPYSIIDWQITKKH